MSTCRRGTSKSSAVRQSDCIVRCADDYVNLLTRLCLPFDTAIKHLAIQDKKITARAGFMHLEFITTLVDFGKDTYAINPDFDFSLICSDEGVQFQNLSPLGSRESAAIRPAIFHLLC